MVPLTRPLVAGDRLAFRTGLVASLPSAPTATYLRPYGPNPNVAIYADDDTGREHCFIPYFYSDDAYNALCCVEARPQQEITP